jgi:arginine decarboxylase
MTTLAAPPPTEWAAHDSARLYGFQDWGGGYFTVSPVGHVQVHTSPGNSPGIDLFDVVHGLQSRELHTPLLLRFSGILEHRLRHFRRVFDRVLAESGYGGSYSLAYPIKVNQQRHLCEEIRDVGSELGFGFEVGSKPELIATLGLTAQTPEMPILCNGFKDAEYLELAILAGKLGRSVTPIVERPEELETILALAERHGYTPPIGVRIRLSSKGVGRWHETTGMRGKFGLSASSMLRVLARLQEADRLDRFTLLHCHVGSQIHDIAAIKRAVTEVAHVYVELRRLGAPIQTLDLGGGLGVDYGGQGEGQDGVNYGLEEYAAVCDDAGVSHPHLVTESGRAVVAYGSVLVLDVLGARVLADPSGEFEAVASMGATEGRRSRPVADLLDAASALDDGEDPLVVYHDAEHARREAEELFSLGQLSLPQRAACEQLFQELGRRLLEVPDAVEELPDLAEQMADQYYCNFSLFQSLPDSWAIDQVFPVTPIHRLSERPERRAVLGDITCDSDGRLDRFVTQEGIEVALPVHDLIFRNGVLEPYYLGVFLVGAYQETLGDLHNLLGDTHAVHIITHEDGSWELGELVEGDTTEEVLHYVQYDAEALRRTLGREIERGIRAQRLTVPAANRLRRALEQSLKSYTYLDHQHPAST